MYSFEHNPLDTPFSKFLYLSDMCEPYALLRPQELLKRPFPELYLRFFRIALTSCPIFAYSAGDYYFVVGFSRSHAFMFDLRTLFLQEVVSNDMISEMSCHSLPLYYISADNLIEAYKSNSDGSPTVVASLNLPSDALPIESIMVENMLITFFVQQSQPSRLVIYIKRTISGTNTACLQFIIEMANTPVYATSTAQHFVAVDKSGTLILGTIVNLLNQWSTTGDSGKPIAIPLESLYVRHTWTDTVDQAVLNGDIPTCCTVSSELGIVVISTTSGKLLLYDIGLNTIYVSPESAILDLKKLLSITPVVFRVLILAGQLIVIFERAMPLFIRLSEHLNQHTFFLYHLFSDSPNHALVFTVKDSELFLFAIQELENRLKNRKPKTIPTASHDDNLSMLVSIWKDTMGDNALSIFTEGLPDILDQQIVTVGYAILSIFEYIHDTTIVESHLSENSSPKLSTSLLHATEWVAKLLIQIDRLECMVQLGLHIYKSNHKEVADLGVTILHNAYYQCMKKNYIDMGLVISHALNYNILEARPYAEYLWEKSTQYSSLLREAENSKVYLLMDRISKGCLTDVASDIKELGINTLLSIDEIYSMLETMDSDLLFADQIISAQ